MASAFVYVALYNNRKDAEIDYGMVKDLYSRGAIDTYDAAVVNKGDDGKVHVSQHEKPTEKAAWTGAAVGALVGVLFPPAILPMAAAGAAFGGLLGHICDGMSRGDLKEIGEALDDGTAGIIVVGKTSLAEKLEKATAKADKRIEKLLHVDERTLNKELAAAAKAAA
jgi:uncharacterized membrane protein